jgi:hypothetical protein
VEKTNTMGCCLSFNQKIETNVALKAPHGTEYMAVDKKQMKKEGDINNWIKSLMIDKGKKNYIVYNDQNIKTFSDGGHCKGILSWDEKNITWLVHSIPHFPAYFTGDTISTIDESQLKYGQSLICLKNIPIQHLDDIKMSLSVMKAHVYISTTELPKSDGSEVRHIKFTGKLVHLSKSHKLEESIYEIIQKRFGGKYIMETWNHGHKTQNTDTLKLNDKVIWPCGLSYTTTQDHSKWAVSSDTVCIGDLNYIESQLHRGGGSVVIKSKKLSRQFRKLIITNK